MTATSSPIGMRARLRRVARALVATLIAVILIAPAHSARADTTVEEEGVLETILAPGGGGVLSLGETVYARFSIINGTSSDLSALTIAFDVNRTPLPTGAALTSWLDEGRSTGVFEELSTQTSVDVVSESSVSLNLFATPEELGELEAGVYPIRVRILAGASDIPLVSPARSVLTVAESRADIALLVPLTLTPADGNILSADELSAATAQGGVLNEQLEALSGTSAILAVDPAIPAAIRALGARAPASAQSWLTALEALPNERFALSFADADLTVQAQASLPEPLGPGDLVPLLDPADFVDADAAEVPLPTMGELTGIRNARSGIAWPRGGIDDAELATLNDYLGEPATTLLPRSAAADATSAVASIDDNRVLLYADQASSSVSQALSAPTAELRATALTAAMARLALTGLSSPIILALDRDEARSGEALLDLVDIIDSRANTIRLDDLLALTPVEATLTSTGESTRADLLPQLLAEEAKLRDFATVLQAPALLTTPERNRLLRLLGVGEPEGGFPAAAKAHRERTHGYIDAVGIRPSSDVQILSASVDLPVWVRNDLPWPIVVHLHARSDDLRLEVEALTVVETIAQNTVRVAVPVQARVASGEVDVALSLTSPTGVRIGEPQVTHVIVRAEWESIGLIVLGSIVVLLLTFGIIRTVRRKRRTDAVSTEAGS